MKVVINESGPGIEDREINLQIRRGLHDRDLYVRIEHGDGSGLEICVQSKDVFDALKALS